MTHEENHENDFDTLDSLFEKVKRRGPNQRNLLPERLFSIPPTPQKEIAVINDFMEKTEEHNENPTPETDPHLFGDIETQLTNRKIDTVLMDVFGSKDRNIILNPNEKVRKKTNFEIIMKRISNIENENLAREKGGKPPRCDLYTEAIYEIASQMILNGGVLDKGTRNPFRNIKKIADHGKPSDSLKGDHKDIRHSLGRERMQERRQDIR